MKLLNYLNKFTYTHPLITTTGLVISVVLLQQVASAIVLATWPEVNKATSGLSIRYLASGLILLLLWHWQILHNAGVTRPMNKWYLYWPLCLVPMLLVAGINIMSIDWGNVEFTLNKIFYWLLANFAAGLFEEVMMRAMAFYLLYRAWKHQRYGIYKAAVTQALIFGLLHLVNLRNDPSLDVAAQVTYASILGFAFAGMVAYSRSIWPAVFAHTFINAMANINPTFVNNYVNSPTSAQMYLVFITIILLFTSVPGYLMLRKASQLNVIEED